MPVIVVGHCDSSKTQSLLNVRDTKSTLQRSDGAASGRIQERINRGDAQTLLEHRDGLANGLEGAWRGALFREAEQLFGKGDAEGALELEDKILVIAP